MERLSDDVKQKIAGAAWDGLREKFYDACNRILNASPSATGELTTVYIKFAVSAEPNAPVYAVIWLKNSRKWIIGLALPDDVNAGEFVDPPKRYAGLTKYFYITPEDPVPSSLDAWAVRAWEFVNSKQ